jgi:hypothetical protein
VHEPSSACQIYGLARRTSSHVLTRALSFSPCSCGQTTCRSSSRTSIDLTSRCWSRNVLVDGRRRASSPARRTRRAMVRQSAPCSDSAADGSQGSAALNARRHLTRATQSRAVVPASRQRRCRVRGARCIARARSLIDFGSTLVSSATRAKRTPREGEVRARVIATGIDGASRRFPNLRLIRFGGHVPKGGYDVPNGEGCVRPASPAAVQ